MPSTCGAFTSACCLRNLWMVARSDFSAASARFDSVAAKDRLFATSSRDNPSTGNPKSEIRRPKLEYVIRGDSGICSPVLFLENSNGESQRDSGVKPRVARNELPWVNVRSVFNPNW